MREFFSSPESFFMIFIIVALIGGFYSGKWGPLAIILFVYVLLVLIGEIK